jgi:hypothetical protein
MAPHFEAQLPASDTRSDIATPVQREKTRRKRGYFEVRDRPKSVR